MVVIGCLYLMEDVRAHDIDIDSSDVNMHIGVHGDLRGIVNGSAL
jgi:hypothetical protein